MKHVLIAVFAALIIFAFGGLIAWYAPVVMMAIGIVLLGFIVVSTLRKRRLQRLGVILTVIGGLLLGLVSMQVVEARRTIQPPNCKTNPLSCR